MKSRCYNPNTPQFYNYGGKGVGVCDEWKDDYVVFHKWALANGYKSNLTIDRIDGTGNYEPSNCKWSTYKEQSHNTSQNHHITYNEKTMIVADWCQLLGMEYGTLYSRLTNYNWSIEKAFTTKAKKRRPKYGNNEVKN